MNNYQVLYDATSSWEDLREGKPLSLTPNYPGLFRQNLKATVEAFMDRDRKNLSRKIFFEEFYKRKKPFTMGELQERIRERGGDPDYFNEDWRLEEALPRWVENGDAKKVGDQYHMVYEKSE
jgi:hypothetical protein